MFTKKYFVLTAFLLIILQAACSKATQPADPILTLGDNTCNYSGPNSINYGPITVSVVHTEKKPLYAGFALVTLQNGKTIKDLQAWPSTTPPLWLTDLEDKGYLQDNRTFSYDLTKYGNYHPYEPLYLVCFQMNSQGVINKIGAFGPIEVTK